MTKPNHKEHATNKSINIWTRWLAAIVLPGLLHCASEHCCAAAADWVHSSGSSSWFAPANWSPGVPTAADDAFIGNGTTAFVEGATAATAGNLFIDSGGVTIGNIGPGNLIVAGEVAIGTAGSSGTFNLNYGTLSVNTLTIGLFGTYSDTSFSMLILSGTDSTIRMANGMNVVVNSTIQGTNGLIKGGLGTLTLANNNTYSGLTIVTIGTLQVGNGGTTGTLGEGNVSNNGALVFNRSDDIVVDNLISGSGSVNKTGSGTLALSADNTYAGSTTISAGTLQVGDGGTSGSLGSGTVTNNARLVFNRSDSIVVGNLITGTGNLVQAGTNKVTLTANNNYSGTSTITNGGTLQVGNGGISGSLGAGSVFNDGSLVFNRSDNIVVSNSVSGSGSFTQTGSGTLTVTANNNYSGFTTISNGTLQVGDGGGTGSLGTNDVFNYGSLVFNRSNAVVVNNVISGTGSLTQVGTNTLTLTASNSYSSGTFVENGGTLIVLTNFALGSGDLNLINGTFKAGATGATNKLIVNVGGNYTQSAGGTLQLTIGGTVSNGGTNEFDQLKITGTATLDGTLHVVGANGYVPHHFDEQRILTADGGITNTFSTFTNDISHSVLVEPRVVYIPNEVTLTWGQLSFLDYLTVSNRIKLTPNQMSVGRGLDSITTSRASNDVALIDYLDYLPDLTNSLPVAFDLIAPEELTAMMVAAFANMDVQGQRFLKRANELRAGYHNFYAATLAQRAESRAVFESYVDRPWNVYFDPGINFAAVHGDDNAAGFNLSRISVTVGADRRLNENLFVGGILGYAGGSADLNNGGDFDVNTFSVSAYATWFRGGLHFEGMLGGDFNSFDSKRASIGGSAEGSTDGVGWAGLIGGGYDWENGPWKFGPQLALQYSSASIRSFTESGSLSPLQIESQDETTLHSLLGANLRYRYHVAGTWTVITPEVYFGWRHEFLAEQYSIDAAFASGAGDRFTVNGPALGSDSIVIGLGVSVQWQPEFNTYFNFTSEVGRQGYDEQSINIGIRYSF